jgi:hypothetical protein
LVLDLDTRGQEGEMETAAAVAMASMMALAVPAGAGQVKAAAGLGVLVRFWTDPGLYYGAASLKTLHGTYTSPRLSAEQEAALFPLVPRGRVACPYECPQTHVLDCVWFPVPNRPPWEVRDTAPCPSSIAAPEVGATARLSPR